jgi:hypothetical protein
MVMTERRLIELAHKRVPLKRLMHGKEIREFMAELETFRQQFNEQEFFYGAKVYLMFNQGEAMAVVRRPETDKELAKRLDIERAEAEAKAERKRIREERELARAERRRIAEAEQAERQRLADIETVKDIVRKLNLKVEDLT